MALNPKQLLSLLQGGGGSVDHSMPVSGISGGTPLSGLMLGEQGMGFGGGESLLGGGFPGGGFGGGGGPGDLELSQLLAQLQAAPGVTRTGLTAPIGFGSLRTMGAPGGEPMGFMPSASQRGQAGLGGASSVAQFLGLLREGVGLGKALTQIFPRGETAADITNLTEALPEMPPDVQAALSGVTPLGGAGPAPTGPNTFRLEQLMTPGGPPTFDLSQLMTPSGPPLIGTTGEAFGPGGAPALSGEFGPSGVGLEPAVGSLLGNFGELLGQAGPPLAIASLLANVGQRFSQGDVRGGLLNLFTGGVGGLVSDLFGGGGPSAAWQSFAPRLAGTLGGERQAASDFVQAILTAQTPQDLEGARQAFLGSVEASGVGGFASRSTPPGWVVPELPGATGTAHEGGQLWNPNAFNLYLNQLYSGTLNALQTPGQFDVAAFQQGTIPLLQQSLQAPGGNSFGNMPLLQHMGLA